MILATREPGGSDATRCLLRPFEADSRSRCSHHVNRPEYVNTRARHAAANRHRPAPHFMAKSRQASPPLRGAADNSSPIRHVAAADGNDIGTAILACDSTGHRLSRAMTCPAVPGRDAA
ncbi:hypothetical protein BMS3Bbin01_02008 [bacterium BMS3Bbin01]|nr:hypothetical protein BMS3Bbin01_02008 [bacterium BMS3Bbin01]